MPAHSATPNSHAAIECTFCHLDTPRFGVDTHDTVNFWRAEGDEPALCERCHGPETNFHPLGVVPGPGRLGTRVPARLPLGKTEAVRDQVVCTSCHFVHAANADFALLRGFPGSDRPDLFRTWQELCRECHGVSLEQRSPHTGDDRSCAFCHSARPGPAQPVTVTPQGRRLCEFCHGPKRDEHFAGVNPYVEPRDCTGCHDPHLGKDHPARLKRGYFDPIRDAATLNPHRKRTLCFACHEGEAGPALRARDVVALCQRCHGSGKIAGMSHPLTKVPSGYTIPEGWPIVSGAMTCLTCHVPGHAPGSVAGRPDEPAGTIHLLRAGPTAMRNEICLLCHAKNQWAGRTPHQDAARGDKKACGLCHAVDPEEGDAEVFVADINILCLRCHDTPDHPGGARHTVPLRERVSEVRGPLPLGTGRRITCATCHDPHLDTQTGSRLRGDGAEGAFCVRCHSL
jgi:predicted CXXCH cytochrome family protein